MSIVRTLSRWLGRALATRFISALGQQVMAPVTVLLKRYLSRTIATLLIVLPALYVADMWLGYRESWVHPELLGSSAYIWDSPESEHFPDRLRKVFDWKAFDPNVNRVRILNDAAEVVDAIARPQVARYFFPHPSFTPVAALTAVLSPFLLFRYLRRLGLDSVRTGALIAVFISSIGFLSVVVAYIHPAKKLTLLLFCVSLYFAQNHARERTSASFWVFIGSLYTSFLADEMDLIKYLVFGVLFFRPLLREAPHWKRLVFLSLPILFLVTVQWGLPAMYVKFGVHGSWKALADGRKLAVLGYLTEADFYRVGLIHTTRAFLTTIGVSAHNAISELLAFVVLVGGTPLLVYRGRACETLAEVRYGLVALAASLFAAGFYATLLDWYPFPRQVSYLGSFTFYYHSLLGILVVLWLAFAWEMLLRIAQSHRTGRQIILGLGIMVCSVIAVANLAMFHHVNRLVQIIHTYPYSSQSLHDEIMTRLPDIRSAERGESITIEFVRERDSLSGDFDSELRTLFGAEWQRNDFYRLFNGFKSDPIMKDNYLSELLHTYFPYNTFVVRAR